MADGTRRWADQFKWIHNPNRAYGSAISLGDANLALPIKVAERPMVSINGTCVLATGTIREMEINYTQTVATAGVIEALRVNITSAVRTGSWTNAIVGRINYGTLGDAAGGMASAIVGEMNIPGKATPGGAMYCFEAVMNTPANATVVAGHTVAFMKFALDGDGTAKTSFNTSGYLFDIQGLGAAGAGLIFDTIGSATPTHELRIKIDAVDYFIMLQATQ